MTAIRQERRLCNMSFQPPSGPGGPPRSTPIPGDSSPLSADQFNQAPPTPSAFLGGQPGAQGQPTPPSAGHQMAYGQQVPYGQPGPTGFPTIPYKKRKRSWGSRIFTMFILLLFFGALGVGAWAVMKGMDAAQQGSDLSNPDLSGGDRDALGLSDDVTFLYEGAGAAAVTAVLDDAIPGEPTLFTDISIFTDYAIVVAQDPAVPGRFDQYIWRSGTVNAPTPQPDNPEAANVTFTVDEVNWNAITALAADAPRLTGVDGGEVSYISVSRTAFIDVGPVVVRIYVNGPRGTGFVEATAAGEFVKAF